MSGKMATHCSCIRYMDERGKISCHLFWLLVLLLAFGMIGSPGIFAQIVLEDGSIERVFADGVDTYTGTRDNTIYEASTNTNGGGGHLFAGSTNNSLVRRTLIAFDLSEIPAGSTILAASLQLTVSRTISGNSNQSLYRLLKDWGEGSQVAGGEEGAGAPAASGDATWFSNFHNTSTWDNEGGDYTATASATAVVGGDETAAVWEEVQLVTDLQNWIDGTHPNHGWILIGNENISTTAKRFYSSDNSTASVTQVPRLTVRYQIQSTGIPKEFWSIY